RGTSSGQAGCGRLRPSAAWHYPNATWHDLNATWHDLAPRCTTPRRVAYAPEVTSPQLTARLSNSPADTRRGVVRLPSEVLDALGLRPWNAVHLTGERSTVALAAPAVRGTAPGVLLLDEITLLNLGA